MLYLKNSDVNILYTSYSDLYGVKIISGVDTPIFREIF